MFNETLKTWDGKWEAEIECGQGSSCATAAGRLSLQRDTGESVLGTERPRVSWWSWPRDLVQRHYLSNSSLTQLRKYNRFTEFVMNDGWMNAHVCDSVGLCGSKLCGGRMNRSVHACVCDLVSWPAQGQSTVMDNNEMSLSSPGTSCHMMSQCPWGIDLGGGLWLYPSVCFPLRGWTWIWSLVLPGVPVLHLQSGSCASFWDECVGTQYKASRVVHRSWSHPSHPSWTVLCVPLSMGNYPADAGGGEGRGGEVDSHSTCLHSKSVGTGTS